MEKEIWKDIPGYENIYQISNYGNIKSLEHIIKSKIKNNKYVLLKEQILKTINSHNYRTIRLNKLGVRKTFSVHRLVALAFIPNPHNKPQINHIDGNRSNNFYLNLEWCTQKENRDHAKNILKVDFGNKGESNPRSKLKFIDVCEIRLKRKLYNTSYNKLAKEYNVCKFTIHSIIKNKIWKI